MKLRFLGTSAGECYPALWCDCPNCRYAREHGGRNLRRYSCAVLDDDVMIDLSTHAFMTAMEMGIDMMKRTTLLVTHNHSDHFDPHSLICRIKPVKNGVFYDTPREYDAERMEGLIGPRLSWVPMLDIYAHSSVYETLHKSNVHLGGYDPNGQNKDGDLFAIRFHALSRGETVYKEAEDLRVTAVTSHHAVPGSCYSYVIQRGGKTLLYACDTGGYDEDMLALLRSFQYDCVVVEGTFGLLKDEDKGHMNLNKNIRMLEDFSEHRLWKGEPRMILTHIAPHGTPPYDLYRGIVEEHGMILAYDGMTVEI